MANVYSKSFAAAMAKDLYHWFIRNGQVTSRLRHRNGDEYFASYQDGKIYVFRMADGWEAAKEYEIKKSWN